MKIFNKEWKFYLNYYKNSEKIIFLVGIITIIASLLILPIAFIIRTIFDQIIPNGDILKLILFSVAILCLQFISSGLLFYINYNTLRITKNSITKLREDLIDKLFSLSHLYYSRSDIGKLQTNIVQDTERIDIMSNALVSSILPTILITIILIPVLIYLNYLLFIVLISVVPIFYIVIKSISKKVRRRITLYQGSFASFNKGILFLLNSIDLVRIQTAEKHEAINQREYIKDLKTKSLGMAWLSTANRLLQEGLLSVVTILILVICGIAVLKNLMTIGEMISFYAVLAILRSFIVPANANISRIIEGNESLKSIYSIQKIKDISPYNGNKVIDFHGNVKLQDLYYGYDKNNLLLERINLEIQENSSISISGLNGTGKTTLLNLILGLYRPIEGYILAEGVDYNKIDLKYLRRSIGVVRQNTYLFTGTILDNLTYGNPEVTSDHIYRILEITQLKSFINKLPQKLDTNIGTNGMALSGGERQKLAIARALIRNPKLLILDELTTHLDDMTIKQILSNIKDISQNMSLIIVSHMSSVIAIANYHYELKNGRLNQLIL